MLRIFPVVLRPAGLRSGLPIGTYLQLAHRCKTSAPLYPQSKQFHHAAGFFENRYRDKNHALMAISANYDRDFSLCRIPLPVLLHGKLFSTLFGVSYLPAMIISAIVIVCTHTLGGFLAASMTDLIGVRVSS